MFKITAQEGSTPIGTKGYHKQKLWFHLFGDNGKLDPFPTQFDKVLGPDEKPYAPGEYQLLPQSFAAVTNEKGNRVLALNRLKMVPLQNAKPA